MTTKGATAFEAHYRSLFPDVYDALKASFLGPFPSVALLPGGMTPPIYLGEPLSWFPWAYTILTPEAIDHQIVYTLSPSSLLPVVALEIHPGETVLDACAAPGGKTIAAALAGAQVLANDISTDRLQRLRRTAQQFGLASQVIVHQGVAEIVARRIGRTFDKILIDAPCSSELHVYESPRHLDQWSHKRIETLHKRQVQMITACLPILSPSGRLVYSTCALTPEENEAVVDEVLERMAGQYRLVPVNWQGLPGDTHQLMHRVWPHKHGLEPMFVAAWERSL